MQVFHQKVITAITILLSALSSHLVTQRIFKLSKGTQMYIMYIMLTGLFFLLFQGLVNKIENFGYNEVHWDTIKDVHAKQISKRDVTMIPAWNNVLFTTQEVGPLSAVTC